MPSFIQNPLKTCFCFYVNLEVGSPLCLFCVLDFTLVFWCTRICGFRSVCISVQKKGWILQCLLGFCFFNLTLFLFTFMKWVNKIYDGEKYGSVLCFQYLSLICLSHNEHSFECDRMSEKKAQPELHLRLV